jgi:hypothetical protein
MPRQATELAPFVPIPAVGRSCSINPMCVPFSYELS